MEDDMLEQLPHVPDLSCPPPGWVGGVKYRGRAQEVGGHPTRVIRRTDLRAKIGGGQRNANKPPQLSNPPEKDYKRSSWGEEWKPEEMLEERDDLDGCGEGEWKQVKGRRWNTGKDEQKKSSPKTSPRSPDTTPEPGRGGRSYQRERRSPPGLNRRSIDQGKPLGNKAGSRRGSSSSYEGDFPSLTVKQRVSPVQKSSPPTHKTTNYGNLMKNIPQMFVSDLPDEQSVRDHQKRRLSDMEFRSQMEDNVLLQKEILVFLKKSWQETCRELEDSSNIWPPKIVYYI